MSSEELGESRAACASAPSQVNAHLWASLTIFRAGICCSPKRRMNNVSYFDHRVIWSCTLSVDIATDWLPGRKNIRRPLCPSHKVMWQQGVLLVGRACDACITWAGLHWGSPGGTLWPTVVAPGNWDSNSASQDLTALPLNHRSPRSGEPSDMRPGTILILWHPGTR